jgi:alkylation response protein AidB-like acyl-CoA dehydrogenase
VSLHSGGTHKERPAAQMRLGQAAVRLDAARALTLNTATEIQTLVECGERVGRRERARARLAAGHVVRESRRVIDHLVEASGGSAHFMTAPFQRAQRDVNTLAGHVIFDYDVSTEMVGALAVGLELPPTALV